MAGLYFDGVCLSAHNEEKDLASIRRRINAHGVSCHADRIDGNAGTDSCLRYWDFYSALFGEVRNLLNLLDEANKEIERSSVSHSPESAVKVNLSLDGQKINRAVQAFNEVMGE